MQQQGNTPHLCHHYTVQNLEFGIWNLKSGIWNLKFGSVMYLQITTGSHTTRIIAVENFYWRVCIVRRRIKKQAAECPRKILWTGIVLAQLWHRAGTALAQGWYGMNSARWCTGIVADENGAAWISRKNLMITYFKGFDNASFFS